MTATRTECQPTPQDRVVVRRFSWPDDPFAARLPGEVHVWTWAFGHAGFRGDEEGALRLDLTADEGERATRYRNAGAREQFVRSRAALRRLLGASLKCGPCAVEIVPNADGKPMLRGGGLQFNVSHTDGVVLIALADCPVGVDVERVRDMPGAAGLVERYFSDAERRQFADLPESVRTLGFFRGWTCKEAVLKGIGCGVRELDRCVVELHPDAPPAIRGPAETAEGWQLLTWRPTPDTLAAVAVATKNAAGLVG
jgi:4'-phosphopantetheinyl transferase